jgi:hypothetical protein
MLTAVELASALKICERQVQRLVAAGMPWQPVGARSKRFDLDECRLWLRINYQCLSSQPKPGVMKYPSASIVKEYTDASRRAQVRVRPSEFKQSSSPPSTETAPRLSLVTQD